LKEVVDEEEKLEWYVAASSGDYTTSVVDDTHFLFKDDTMIQIDNSDLPVSGFHISMYGMMLVRKTLNTESYEGSEVINFWFQQY